MTGRSVSDLTMERVNEIAEVDASDRKQARLAIAGGVRAAEENWIAAHFIAEALVLELVTVVQGNRSGAEVAAYLRSLAHTLETQGNLH